MRNDDSILAVYTEDADKAAYRNDKTNYSKVAWRRWRDPTYHWAMPVVPNHKYRLVWGDNFNYDYTYMRFEVTQYLWGDGGDPSLEGDFFLEMPFRGYREGVTVMV